MGGAILGVSGECVRDVDRGYQLIFGENIGIGVASGGDREDSVRLNSVPFCIVCKKLDITNEERDNFQLDRSTYWRGTCRLWRCRLLRIRNKG